MASNGTYRQAPLRARLPEWLKAARIVRNLELILDKADRSALDCLLRRLDDPDVQRSLNLLVMFGENFGRQNDA